MTEEITQKHLERARVQGAPSTIPGASGLVRPYPYEEQTRQTVRALSLELDNDFSIEQLQRAQATLAQHAAKQGLRVLEQPMFALSNDPTEDIPSEWQWTLLPSRSRSAPTPPPIAYAAQSMRQAIARSSPIDHFPEALRPPPATFG